jgi:CHAT domain-containing protein
LNKWTADEEFLGTRLAAITELTQTAARLPWWRRFFLERRRRRDVALFLSQIDRHQRITFGRAMRADSSGSDTWQAEPVSLRTSRDTAVLGFLVLPDRLVVARLCRRRADVSVRPLTRLELRQLVSDWHGSVVSGGPSHVAADRMSQVQNALGFGALLEGLPAGVRHLRIVADDSLRGVPFGALDFRGQPVIARFSVTTAFAWSPDRATRTGQPAGLAVGVGGGAGGFPPLENASPEVAMVCRWLARHRIRVTRLEDDQATCSRVAEHLPGVTHLHVASHGVFSRDQPDRSGLVMSGGKDDLLTLRDLAGLDLAGLRLVVLSACWAADNFILPGRVVLSLPYTLWRAGARAVLAPLWEIDDAVALAFMTRFYDCLESMSPREALRQVQQECLQGALPGCTAADVADPIHWAAFQLFGDGAGDLTG